MERSYLARLLYTDVNGRQQALELDPARPQVVIGRQADCDIVAHDTSVSRRHCIVVPETGGFAVVDLGSANGTLINDVRITRRLLAPNDVIRCGGYAVRFVERAELSNAADSLSARYRRARGAADGPLRAQLERLQAFNQNQTQRLIQLQEELTRVEAERLAAIERLALVDGELTDARRKVGDLEVYLAELGRLLEARDQQISELSGVAIETSGADIPRVVPASAEPPPAASASPPPAEPPPPEPPPPGADHRATDGMVMVALAAQNEALRAELATLQGALAVEDAYTRAAQIVPTVDRWQALDGARREVADLRRRLVDAQDEAKSEHRRLERRIRELKRNLTAADERAADANAEVDEARAEGARLGGRIAELEEALREAQDSVSAGGGADVAALQRKLAETESALARAESRLRLSSGRGLGGAAQAGSGKGLLKGLGGLGQTARPRTSSSLTARLAPRDKASAPTSGRETALESALQAAERRRSRVHDEAEGLVARLEALAKRGASSVNAGQIAELTDLARTIHALVAPAE